MPWNNDITTISESTCFDLGAMFTSPAQVREYMTVENMNEMFAGYLEIPTTTPPQSVLDKWAEIVIENEWNCCFDTA